MIGGFLFLFLFLFFFFCIFLTGQPKSVFHDKTSFLNKMSVFSILKTWLDWLDQLAWIIICIGIGIRANRNTEQRGVLGRILFTSACFYYTCIPHFGLLLFFFVGTLFGSCISPFDIGELCLVSIFIMNHAGII